MTRQLDAGAKKAEASFFGLENVSLKSSRKVASNLKAIESALLSGADAATLTQIGLLKVSESFKLGFGGTVALAGVALAVGKISEAVTESEKLGVAFKEALRPGAAQGFEGIDAAKVRVKELQAVIEEGRKKRGLAGGIGDLVSAVGSEFNFGENSQLRKSLETGHLHTDVKNPGAERARGVGEAEAKRADYYLQIARAQGEINTLKERGLAQGERSVKVAELELEKQLKLAAVENDLGLPKLREKVQNTQPGATRDNAERDLQGALKARDQQNKELDREYGLKQKVAALDEGRGLRALDLETHLLTIKKAGREVDVSTAEARLTAARAAGGFTPAGSPERAAAVNAIAAAEQELETARRISGARAAELDVQARAASLSGTADEKRLFVLREQLKVLQAQEKVAKPDERAGINRDITANREQQRLLGESRAEKGYRQRVAGIEASGGIGEGEDVKRQMQLRAAARERVATMKADRTTDPERLAEARTIAATLERQLQGIGKQRLESLATAKAETTIMRADVSGQTTIATQLGIALGYQQKINAARDAGNTALATELGLQENLAQQRAAFDAAAGKSPGDLRTEKVGRRQRNEAFAEFQRTGGAEKNDGLDRPEFDTGGRLKGGIDPETGEFRGPSATYRKAEASGNLPSTKARNSKADASNNLLDRLRAKPFLSGGGNRAEENRPAQPEPKVPQADASAASLVRIEGILSRMASKIAVAE